MRISKRHEQNKSRVEPEKLYSVQDAVTLAREMAQAKFDESIEISLRLGVDPKKADQMVRGTVGLPHGTGKDVRVLVFATGEDADAAKEAGADHVGLEELVEKIQGGWFEFDIAIAAPPTMREVGKLGKALGPRGLMPSPKAGTVTPDVAEAVKEFKAGKVEFRVDKQAGIHCAVGRISFEPEKIIDNLKSFFAAVINAKPSAVRGIYLQKAAISTTMGPGIKIDPNDAARIVE
jgi:large subunit ribosomal protein L1